MSNFSDRGVKQSIDWKLVVSYLLLILIGTWLRRPRKNFYRMR